MPTKKTTSNLVTFTLFFTLLLLAPFLSLSSTDNSINNEVEEEDLDQIEQLVAIDEEQEQQQQHGGSGSTSSSSEAKVLSQAQRIVVELNNDNTKKVIDQNEYVLLMGYTPWCPRSAELMPQFAQAANLLSELGSPVLMAKLDAERYPKTASALDIKGYPTLLLFTNSTPQRYTGGFTAEDIMIWTRKKTSEPVIRLTSVSEAEAFASTYSMFVLGFFDQFEGLQYANFVRAAVADNEIQFAETNSDEVAELLFPGIKSTKPFLGLVKSEPEKYTVFEEPVEMKKILQFLEYNKFPLVTKLTELNSVKVYSSPFKIQVYVFADSEEFKCLLQPLQDVAKRFKSKILFIYVDIAEENLAKPFLTLLGFEDSTKTVVAAFDNKISSKYLLESEPTPSKLEEFCSRLLQGTVPTYYRSQPVPDNENASVIAVVGKTFDDMVLSSPKNIFLEVYTPWCVSCEATTKQVEKLAKHFKALENLIFARIDASANEHPKLQITDFPALLFYPVADKSNPIKLSTKSSLKDLGAFIKKNVKPEEQAAKDEL